MDWIEILRIVFEVIGGFAVIATQTRNGSTSKGINAALKFINLVGQNYGQAENK
jgi:hypothetical protein